MKRRNFILLAVVLVGVYGFSVSRQNEYGIKPLIKKHIEEIYQKTHGKPAQVEMRGSNFPLSFALAMPGKVDTLARINGEMVEITHEVEFFGVTPVISHVTGGGTFRLRILPESGRAIAELK